MPESPSRSTSNRILSRLSAKDFALLRPHLDPIELPLRKSLEVRNRRIDNIYFVERGFASVVADGSGARAIEVGLIGREGMTGLAVVLGKERASNDTFMQAAGAGLRISAKDLRRGIDASVSLHRAFLGYAHSFLEQTAQTALANGRSKIEERLARWLLMARDRLDGDELPLTHEFLSIMLGVRRAGVTTALQELEQSGLISTRRGFVTILDRNALEKNANGAYAPPNGE